MEYNAEGNFEENNNNDNNELYILSNDDTKENNNNIFEVRENAFTRNEKNGPEKRCAGLQYFGIRTEYVLLFER